MVSSRWQKQNIHLRKVVRIISVVISILLVILLLSLELLRIETAGLLFVGVFGIMEVTWAFVLKDRYANSMVRVLRFNYEEIERDFRMVFKDKHIRYYRKSADDAYSYEFPGHSLSMNVQPYVVPGRDMNLQPATKVTLRLLDAKNQAFAEMIAESIDDMAIQRANSGNNAEESL